MTTLYPFHPWIESEETSETVISPFGRMWDGSSTNSHYIQSSSSINSGTTAQVTLTTTTGNTLVAFVLQTSAANRTYTVSDNHGDTWTQREVEQHSSNFQISELWSAHSITGGSTTITATANASSINFRLVVIEIVASDYNVSDSFENPAQAEHFAVGVSGINTTQNVFVVAGFAMNASVTTTKKSDWTIVHNESLEFIQFVESVSALNGERGEITNDPTNRTSAAVIASFTTGASEVEGIFFLSNIFKSNIFNSSIFSK